MPPKFEKTPRAVLARKRTKLVALARRIAAERPLDLRVQPLAIAFGVSCPTARKWLDEAGLTMAARRGRPLKGESVGFDDIQSLLAAAARQGEAIMQHGEEVEDDNG